MFNDLSEKTGKLKTQHLHRYSKNQLETYLAFVVPLFKFVYIKNIRVRNNDDNQGSSFLLFAK